MAGSAIGDPWVSEILRRQGATPGNPASAPPTELMQAFAGVGKTPKPDAAPPSNPYPRGLLDAVRGDVTAALAQPAPTAPAAPPPATTAPAEGLTAAMQPTGISPVAPGVSAPPGVGQQSFPGAFEPAGASPGSAEPPKPAMAPSDAAPIDRLKKALEGLTREEAGGGSLSREDQISAAWNSTDDSMAATRKVRGLRDQFAKEDEANASGGLAGINARFAEPTSPNADPLPSFTEAAREGTGLDPTKFKLTPEIVNGFLQSDTFKKSLNRDFTGVNSDAVNLQLRDDPDLSERLSSYAALGQTAPRKPEEQLLNPNLFSSQGAFGNTLNLGFFEEGMLPPLGSGIRVSTPSEFKSAFLPGA